MSWLHPRPYMWPAKPCLDSAEGRGRIGSVGDHGRRQCLLLFPLPRCHQPLLLPLRLLPSLPCGESGESRPACSTSSSDHGPGGSHTAAWEAGGSACGARLACELRRGCHAFPLLQTCPYHCWIQSPELEQFYRPQAALVQRHSAPSHHALDWLLSGCAGPMAAVAGRGGGEEHCATVTSWDATGTADWLEGHAVHWALRRSAQDFASIRTWLHSGHPGSDQSMQCERTIKHSLGLQGQPAWRGAAYQPLSSWLARSQHQSSCSGHRSVTSRNMAVSSRPSAQRPPAALSGC